uniref:Uncharacterized protein n=1 Tax=Accipiter nisus TaxID=211598 RepID=A0A8B9NJ82_9AVES
HIVFSLFYFWKRLFEAHYSDLCHYGLFFPRLLEIENEQLQDQLREVRDENCRLYKLVTEKDFEIKQLQKKIQDNRLALLGASALAGDVAATKIVELAKKNREITAETESEKAKVKQLNNKVKELERELQTAIEKIHSLGGGDAEIKQSALKMIEENLAESPKVKALQEKLTTANFKAMEYRNQLQSAKQELKMTQKVLLQHAVCGWDPGQEVYSCEIRRLLFFWALTSLHEVFQ